MLSSASRFGVVHTAGARKRVSGGGDAPENTVAPTTTPALPGDQIMLPGDSRNITGTQGTWTGSGITYSYQWYNDADDTALAGLTSLTIPNADTYGLINVTMYLLVTATNGGGSVSARSSTNTSVIFIDG